MDSIDKSLNSLMQQIESIDGKHGYNPGTANGILGSSSSLNGQFSMLCRKYFFYWSLFLFVMILILVIKPSNIYHYNPVSRQTTFSLTSFFLTVLFTYFMILSLYWIHVMYCTST